MLGYLGEGVVDVAHMDDDRTHSYLFNLVPMHRMYNRGLGGQSHKSKPVEARYAGLDWHTLLERAQWHHQMGNSRRAYACVRVGYYVLRLYYLERPFELRASLMSLYEAMTKCLYYARHVWNDDILWGLLAHELRWLLHQEVDRVPRSAVAGVARGIGALWMDLSRPHRALAIGKEVDALLAAGRDIATSSQEQCSRQRRHGMASVAHSGRRGLSEGKAFAEDAMQLAKTPEERVNAGEVVPWIAADRGEWSLARSQLEAICETEVQRPLEVFVRDVEMHRGIGWLGVKPLLTPVRLTLLNAAQVPWDLAVAIVKGTHAPNAAELRQARYLAALAGSVHSVLETSPSALTESVRSSQLEVAHLLGGSEYVRLALGRRLSPRTVRVLGQADQLAMRRTREAMP